MSNGESKPEKAGTTSEVLDVRIRAEEMGESFFVGECYGYRQGVKDMMQALVAAACIVWIAAIMIRHQQK
jgi:hypothetical protein